MIALALKSLGLMRVSEHEAATLRLEESIASREREIDHVVSERNEALAKFKRAATDLAKQAEELNEAKLHIDHLGITFNQRLADAVQDYQGDAQKWRNSLKRSRDRKAAKNRGGGK